MVEEICLVQGFKIIRPQISKPFRLKYFNIRMRKSLRIFHKRIEQRSSLIRSRLGWELILLLGTFYSFESNSIISVYLFHVCNWLSLEQLKYLKGYLLRIMGSNTENEFHSFNVSPRKLEWLCSQYITDEVCLVCFAYY